MNQYHFQAPPLTKINKILLITGLALFLLSAILKAVGAFNLLSVLGLSLSGLGSGFIFQFLSYPLIEAHLMNFLFNALVLWFIGSELESKWSTQVYGRFLVLNVLAVGLIFCLINFLFLGGLGAGVILHGFSGINFALLTAYALLYPDRQMSMMMIFPMRSRTFCMILIGIEAYMALFSNFTASWAHLSAMGMSYLIIHFQNRPLVHKVLNSTLGSNLGSKKRSKNHLYVVKDEEDKPPKYWQ
jgi:membrane associated rhomboid family serine protease